VSPQSKSAKRSRAGKTISLTELDWAILEQMSLDPLASNRAVAEVLGVSTGQVAARVRWLDQKQVTRVIAVLDLAAAGQSFCYIQIDIRGRPIDDVAADITLIRKTLAVIALGGGTSDLLVLLRFTTMQELHELLYNTLAKIAGVYHISVSNVIDIPIFRRQYVSYMPHFLSLDASTNVQDLAHDYPESVIDHIDRCIIAELQQDGRKSINDIARQHDINASTIRYRVKNLESKGLLRFITVFDPLVIGIKAVAILEIQVASNHINAVIDQLIKKRDLHQLFLCAGSATLMSIVNADAVETIQRIKREEIGPIEGVIDVKVTPFVHTYKADLRWGQRFTE
jgi:Lrp/AsnC family transcriptional regulator for asnA, asnC and gidA